MREIRPSGSEGGVADNGHPYPYRGGSGPDGPVVEIRARRPAGLIGVEMAVVGHPSLRTGQADFPHPALQSVSHPLTAGLVRLARAKAYREISP